MSSVEEELRRAGYGPQASERIAVDLKASGAEFRAIPEAPFQVHCCLCLNVSGKLIHATTIVGGYAVCADHAEYVAAHHAPVAGLIRQLKLNATATAT